MESGHICFEFHWGLRRLTTARAIEERTHLFLLVQAVGGGAGALQGGRGVWWRGGV